MCLRDNNVVHVVGFQGMKWEVVEHELEGGGPDHAAEG